LVLRAAYESRKYEQVRILAVNDAFGAGKMDQTAFMKQVGLLLAYDTVHGKFTRAAVEVEGDKLIIGDEAVKVFHQTAIPPWGELGVDVVIESTGVMRDFAKSSAHLQAGAKRVIISAPAKGEDVATFVMGVNEETYDSAKHPVVSNASCTTNCLAPLAKVMLEGPGIVQGWMTTIHAYTNDQNLVDGFHKEELRRARAGALAMIPTKTGAAEAVELVIPQLKGKITGAAIRVPTPNVSAVDFVFNSEKPTTVEEVNELLKQASIGRLKGILGYVPEELVSLDFNHDNRSSIIDAKSTRVINGQLVRVLSWYDNEWGYANRLLDLALYMASKGL